MAKEPVNTEKEAPKPSPAPAPEPKEPSAGGTAGAGYPEAVDPKNLLTEQEKGKPDPVSKAEPSPGPVETMEDQGIGAKTPYPSKGD